MDILSVRIECLKLAASRLASKDPKEIVELAKAFENYMCEDSSTCSPSKDGGTSVTSEQKPNDAAKVQNKDHKWFKK